MNYIAPKPQGTATFDDILNAPEGMLAQIINGELVLTPNGTFDHQSAGGELAADLKSHFRKTKFKPGGWVIVQEMLVRLDNGEFYRPDLSGWRTETLPKAPEEFPVEVAPDWVCEVLSPSTRSIDRTKKMPIYARSSVSHYWIVDPRARSLEVFRLEGDNWVLTCVGSDNDVIAFEPFEDVEIDLSYLWIGGDQA